MTTPKSVLVLGAGFVGRPIIDVLLASNHKVTTLVRNPEVAPALEKAGIATVIGTLDDADVIMKLASKHDIVINTSSSDHLASIEAVLEGVRQRVSLGLPTTFLHTSGAALFLDGANGAHTPKMIYRDDEPAVIDALPDAALHRNVDLVITGASREFGDKAKIMILIPPMIFGFNPAYERTSMAFPKLVSFALKNGFSGYVGQGLNEWSKIHVNDVVSAVAAILAYSESVPSSALLSNPYFFVDDGTEFSFGDAGKEIARALYKMGKIPSPEAKQFVEADFDDLFGPYTEFILGGNAVTHDVRLREFGWEPKETYPGANWEEEELPFIIATQSKVVEGASAFDTMMAQLKA